MNKVVAIKHILLGFVNSAFYKELNVLSDEETIEYIVNNKCSISRFGDGEIMIMTNAGSIEFQDYSSELQNRLIEVANDRVSGLLVCVPEIVSNDCNTKYTELAIKFWKKHLLVYGGYYRKLFNKQNILGDTNVSRFYLGIKNRERTSIYVEKLRRIWDKRDLLIVEGYNTKLGIGNDLFSNCRSIERILCSNKNCFSSYKEIYQSVIKNHKKNQLVICALGPTASILCYDLQKNMKIQSLDLGHIDIEYMRYLKKANQRIPVEGKNTAEFNSEYELKDIDRKDVIGRV